MDEKNIVMITVSGTDEEGETISLRTRGTLLDSEDSDMWSLWYEETDPSDMTGTQTLLQCEGKRVTVSRAGSALSTIVFEAGEVFESDYTTPMGGFRVRVYASEVTIGRRGQSGRLRIVYQISLTTNLSPSEESALRKLDIRFVPCRR